MSNYKIIKCPCPVDKLQAMYDSFLASRSSPGGCAVRYRMPKQMVALVNEQTGAGDDETYGMGLGTATPMTFLLQPRQYDGIMNAKSKGKSYALVLTRKQLSAMEGQGLFSSLIKLFKPVAKEALKKAGKEVGKYALKKGSEAVMKKVSGRGDEESSEEEDVCVCTHCMGSGLLPKNA